MLNFKKLKKSQFALVESVLTYKDMSKALFVPSLKTSLVAIVFIFLGQTILSYFPHDQITNICFWVWTLLVAIVSTISFFKTSEDLILNQTPHIYNNISHVLLVSAKLFTVITIIVGVIALLIIPMFLLENPLFALPYKFLVVIFLIAAIPFVYFAPLAVVLRGAKIFNSFTFSYYMVLSRWSIVAKAVTVQLIFTAMVIFWVYFLICIIVFPNNSDFLNFMFTKATALEMQSRSLYPRFILWEALQVFAFIFMTAIFTGANTIFFMYLEGTLFNLTKEKSKSKDVDSIKSVPNIKVNFVDVLTDAKSVNIDASMEKQPNTSKATKEDIYDDGYSEYQDQSGFSMDDFFDESGDVEMIEDEEIQDHQEKKEESKETAKNTSKASEKRGKRNNKRA